MLKTEGVDIRFVHIGGLRADTTENKRYADSLKQLAVDLQVQDRITWLGIRNDIKNILPAFDVYVHPSREEGLGVVLLEAAVAGLPLVGSRVGGIPEVVEDGKNGYLFEYGDFRQLADIIKRLANDIQLRTILGAEARKKVRERFDMKRQTYKLIDLYLGKE